MTHTVTKRAKVERVRHVDGVLVVGGGFAGLHAATAVRRSGIPVTVVDRTGRHDFVTRLAAVAGGTAPVEDASQPLGSFIDRVMVGSVAEISDGSVTLSDGHTVTAEAVVVTAGSEPSMPPINGIEFAQNLRSAEEAVALRAAIASAKSVVIVGGGATGVQLAAASAVSHPSITIHLVEASSRLLAGMPGALSAGAMRILEGRNVRIHLGSNVEVVTDQGAVVDGTLLEGLVVWAGGFSALAQHYGVPTTIDGRIVVDAALRIRGNQRTFAAGDIAGHLDRDGEPLPMSAQIAVRGGAAAGRNAARTVRGEPVEAVDLRQLGWVLDLGGNRGLAQIGPINLTAPGADLIPPLIHEAIDLKDLLEIGGIGALRHASASVRSLFTVPLAIWSTACLGTTAPVAVEDGRDRGQRKD